MTTSMAEQQLEFVDNQRFEQLNHQQLEQRMFNTGPRATKTFPTTSSAVYNDNMNSNSRDAPLSILSEDSVDGQMRVLAAPSNVNEGSNMSSAGSTSDREPDTPGKTRAISEKKSGRKRRRVDDNPTPKAERKITEFIRPVPGSSNGDHYLHEFPPGSGNWIGVQSPSPVNRTTPTQLHYSSDSNNSSNSSPPDRRLGRGIDQEAQTDPVNVNVEDLERRDRVIADYRKQLDEAQSRIAIEKRKNEQGREMIKRLLIEKNNDERKMARDKVANMDNPRIGQYKHIRAGDSFKEVFVEGWAFEELQKKIQAINVERNELNNASQLLKKRKPVAPGKEGTSKRAQAAAQMVSIAASDTSVAGNSADDSVFRRPEEPKEINMQEYIELEEIYKLRKEHLKKEEIDVAIEKDKLEREKQLHLREIKRATNERDSRYRDHEMLSKRYLLLSLLGKGGFSEVWRAYDLDENRYVACKIHHVNKEWKEDKKANYVKHAMREKDIHKSLDHCRIVRLFDLFTIDNHSFCTVLEYCPGNDLDFYLKQNKSISEKEARSIIMQLVSAMVYLNEKKPAVIHYDLKPANILLESGTTCGAIKITDFGLSKMMENDCDDLELTSQFAGTYWYLPPETFVVGHQPPKISSKVDVWSIGVIFYQCIYGRKPFGNELSQQRILEENTIIRAREVTFPAKPPLSQVAQDFILRCLQYNKEDRADVFELARHELFRPRGAKSGMPSSPSVSRSLSLSRDEEPQ